MKTEPVIASIEKAFRYLVPGFLFVFLLKAAYPSKPALILQNIVSVEFAILIPCLGMMVYGVHRVIWWTIFDYIFAKCGVFVCSKKGKRYSEILADFISWRRAAPQGLLDYLHYRWSILHYTLILSELVICFSILNEEASVFHRHRGPFVVAAVGLWVLSMIHYYQMLVAEECVRSRQGRNEQKEPGDGQ
jgi:hypothetical protein